MRRLLLPLTASTLKGATTTLRIALSRAGRALLARHARKLTVTVSASVRDAAGVLLPARTAFSGRRR